MKSERVAEPFLRTIARNLTIAIVVGAVLSLARRAPPLPAMVLALWPSLGGHFVEIAFLDLVKPRLPRARLAQVSARILWWLVGGALLGAAVIATSALLPGLALGWRLWWLGPPIFVGVELAVHAALALRGRPSFYRGDG